MPYRAYVPTRSYWILIRTTSAARTPLEERDDRPSPTIIPEDDSKDEEAPDEESRVEPNPEVYKPPVPYPQLLS